MARSLGATRGGVGITAAQLGDCVGLCRWWRIARLARGARSDGRRIVLYALACRASTVDLRGRVFNRDDFLSGRFDQRRLCQELRSSELDTDVILTP